MPHYLFDTDWVIHYMNGHAAIRARVDRIDEGALALSVVSLAELYEGVYYSHDPEATARAVGDFVDGVKVLAVDAAVCQIFGRERGRLRQIGRTIGDFDLIIGATAIRHEMTLLTNTRKHFSLIDGLVIESSQDSPA